MYKVVKYLPRYLNAWNELVKNSKNSTFLFNRNFIEYHKDKFHDCSLIIFDKKNNMIACLAANYLSDNEICSHSGLSYGGIVLRKDVTLNNFLIIIKSILQKLDNDGVKNLHLKLLPDFYSRLPSQEIEYALFLLRSKLYRIDTSLVVNLSNKLVFQTRRRRSINKSNKFNLQIKPNDNFSVFWNNILIPNLKKRFNVDPVHSLDEILYLKKSFPENIIQYNIYHHNHVIAGTTIFKTDNVAHIQYISANDFGRTSGALDLLFENLITNYFRNMSYLDFGICNEDNGLKINHGLLNWKESFGARTYVNKFHIIDCKNYELLNSVINEN